MVSEMPKSEKAWQARMDAQTLAEANVIKEDKGRLKAAESTANKLATEAQEQASAMSKVASKPSRSTTASSDSGGKKSKAKSAPMNPLLSGIPGKRR